MKATLD